MTIAINKFGEFDGTRVDQFTLRSDSGVEVDVINYGVVVRDWRVPAAGGHRSVVLGFENFDAYPAHSPYFGAVVGRVANRIAGAGFDLDGQRFQLPPGQQGYTLHGGPQGLANLVWDSAVDTAANAVRFTIFSPDGAMGFPGNVEFGATYSLSGNRLRLDLTASTDRKTPISLVQHHYFNLGTGSDVLDHKFQIAADAYTELHDDLIPTGAILPVGGSKWDFRQPRTLRDAAGNGLRYDGNLVLDQPRDLVQPAAVVTGPDDLLTLKIWTDRPGLQLYNAAYADVPVPGLGGRRYGRYSGFCLEDQALPDAVHHKHFPPIWYEPGKDYQHRCDIEIA